MSWFNKHLNWTYVIINFLISILSLIIILAAAGESIRDFMDNPDVFPTALLVVILISSGISVILNLAASAWILWKKGQSLWWLALILVFSAALFVLALVLPRKKTGQVEKGKISDSDYYKSRGADGK
jgi:ABC-type Fe3+-siderophore transport system permease subunit